MFNISDILENIYANGNCSLSRKDTPNTNLVLELNCSEDGTITSILKRTTYANEQIVKEENIKSFSDEELINVLSIFVESALLQRNYNIFSTKLQTNFANSMSISIIYAILDAMLSNWSYKDICDFLNSQSRYNYLVNKALQITLEDINYSNAITEINRKFLFLKTKFNDVLPLYNEMENAESIESYVLLSESFKEYLHDDTLFEELKSKNIAR